MKIIKSIFPSLLIFVVFLITNRSCTVGTENSMEIGNNFQVHNKNNLLINKSQSHEKHKTHKTYRLKSTSENFRVNEEDLDELSSFNNKSQQQNDSIYFISWFIFVPLVLLIFIMTILSIAGFLILILNSSATNKSPSSHAHSSQLSQNNLLLNNEIIDILRSKRQLKKKLKNTKNNYKPEPEPEGVIVQ